MAQEDWMAKYQDRKLGEMHLPGSHDAGTAKNYIDKTFFGTNSNSATQSLTISEQLTAGTRFFDLRLASHNKQIVAHHTTAGQGAYSKIPVDTVLSEAAQFCSKHRTEVVIFRISHTSLSTNADRIAIASAAGQLHTGTGNLCTKKLSEIVSKGGGLVCIFDEEKFGAVIDQSKGIHGFSKYGKNPANDRGISACGCYSGTHKLNQVVCNGLKGQYEHNEQHSHRHEHLWQVYWQKTYVNPFSTTGIETGSRRRGYVTRQDGKWHGGTHVSAAYMVNLMRGLGGVVDEDFVVAKEESHKEGWRRKKVVDKESVMYSTRPVRNYALPNIFSYDFVNEATNKTIITMNDNTLQSAQGDGS